jgi:hypothetical protein
VVDVANGFRINLPEVERIAKTVVSGGDQLNDQVGAFDPMHANMGAVRHSAFLAELGGFTDSCRDALTDIVGQVHTFGGNVTQSAKEYAAADAKAHEGIFLAGGN